MSTPKKAAFSPVPPRAAGDKRLTASHYRILIAIASHDRMSKCRGAGQGCWAGNKTLAREANVNYTNFSTLAHGLIAWGYITREHHPLSRRMHVYRVEYDGLPTGKHSTGDAPLKGLPVNNRNARTVCPDEKLFEQNQCGNDVEYSSEKEIITKKSLGERYSAEAAPPLRVGEGLKKRVCGNPGATLALIENGLADGSRLDDDTRRAVCQILDEHYDNQAIREQAQRILNTTS